VKNLPPPKTKKPVTPVTPSQATHAYFSTNKMLSHRSPQKSIMTPRGKVSRNTNESLPKRNAGSVAAVNRSGTLNFKMKNLEKIDEK
jgi:hypothetical protein